MKKLDFNSGWTCRNLTTGGEAYPVRLPHDAMRTEERNDSSLGTDNIGWYVACDYEYAKVLTVPEAELSQTMTLMFESVYRNAEVYVNGALAAQRPYGYAEFLVELNPYLKAGDNEIRVIAHNSDQPNSRWYSGTGIYRPVWLYVGKKDYIPVYGVQIKTLSIDPAEILVRVKTSTPGEAAVEILDGDRVAASASLTAGREGASVKIRIPDAKLWNPEDAYLYVCRVTYRGDVVEETFGIRLVECNPEVGFAINGKRVILRGACVHHDNGLLGACTYYEEEERRVRILMENGYNAIRSSHNPCSRYMAEACDKLGMLILDEYTDGWYIHKTEHDYADVMEQWWEKDLAAMAAKDYNHPSVIMYSLGNEVAETAQPKGIELTGKMTQFLHSLDDTRTVTCGINILFNLMSSMGMGVYSDDKSKKDAENAEKAAAEAEKAKKAAEEKAAKEKAAAQDPKKKKKVGSEFYNTVACLLGDYAMKIGATLPPCDGKTRDAFANMDVAGYNYGILRYEHDLKKYPNRIIVGSETFCKDAYLFYEKAKKHKRIIGDFVWSGWEYIGECGAGCCEYSDYKSEVDCERMTGGNGRIDLLGKPRSEAAFTRVAFEKETGPYIAVKPAYQTEKLNLTGWQLTKGLESWAWDGCSGNSTDVDVFARAASVELFVNGTSVGKKKLKNTCRCVFHTQYQDGEIRAVSYDENGGIIGEYAMQTGEKQAHLSVFAEEAAAKKDGLVHVWLRYTDANGVWKPMEKHHIRIAVQGGELLGLGSANAYAKGNYAVSETDTYYGEAMAIVRAGSGDTLTVTADDGSGVQVLTIACE